MSEKEIRTVFRAHWAWNDDKEERWLENMARQGWHLERPWAFITDSRRASRPRWSIGWITKA